MTRLPTFVQATQLLAAILMIVSPSLILSIVLDIHLHVKEGGGGGAVQALIRAFLLNAHNCTYKYTYRKLNSTR